MRIRVFGLAVIAGAMLPAAGCGGGSDSTSATTAAGAGAAAKVVAGASILERALSLKLHGAVNCGKEKLPPADGKTVTCTASADDPDHGQLAGDLKLMRKGTTLSYSASLTYPGGVKVRAGVMGLDGGRTSINLTPH